MELPGFEGDFKRFSQNISERKKPIKYDSLYSKPDQIKINVS